MTDILWGDVERHQSAICASCDMPIHFIRWDEPIDAGPGYLAHGYWIHDNPCCTGCMPEQMDPDLITFAWPKVEREDCPTCDGRGEIFTDDLYVCGRCGGFGVLNPKELGWLE